MSTKVRSFHFPTMNDSIGKEKSTTLITRDLLGGCCGSGLGSRELELDSHVPFRWDKHFDSKSGKVCLQLHYSPPTSWEHSEQISKTISKQSVNQFAEMSLDLKLVSSSSTPLPSSTSTLTNYQSVCTLDKVKCALERAEKEKAKKRSPDYSDSYSSSSIGELETNCGEKSSPLSFATGCPNCLLYVLISVENPECPRCHMTIASSIAVKKPRIDLNISI